MGKIFGGVTDALGLTDYEGQEEAAKQAGFNSAQQYALTKESIALQKETFAFQKEQYADWKDIYGSVQENLGKYYENLNPDDLTAMGLQNQQSENQRAISTIERDAAQRGISGSGMEFAAKSTATFQNAEARARIRSESDEKVAEQKLGFLGIGLNQGQAMLGNINQASANVNQAYGTGIQGHVNSAASYNKQYTTLSSNNQEAAWNVAGMIAGA